MAHFFTYESVNIPLKFTTQGVLTDYLHIVVTISQYGVVTINKDENDLGIDVEHNTIYLPLSQEETSQFRGGTKTSPEQASIQVNIYYSNSNRDVSTIQSIDIYDNLYKLVMSNE